MLSSLLHKHIDRMDEIEAQLQADIDEIMAKIDPAALVQDTDKELSNVIDAIGQLINEKYIPLASQIGFELAEVLEKLIANEKTMPVDGAKDPDKNKDIVE